MEDVQVQGASSTHLPVLLGYSPLASFLSGYRQQGAGPFPSSSLGYDSCLLFVFGSFLFLGIVDDVDAVSSGDALLNPGVPYSPSFLPCPLFSRGCFCLFGAPLSLVVRLLALLQTLPLLGERRPLPVAGGESRVGG